MKHTHRVKRTFPAAQPVSAGQMVDASNWRNRTLLERGGYIEPIKQDSELENETEPANETAEAASGEPVEVQEPSPAAEMPTATVSELLEIVAPAEEKLPEVVEAPVVTAPAEAPKTGKTSSAKKSTSKTKK